MSLKSLDLGLDLSDRSMVNRGVDQIQGDLHNSLNFHSTSTHKILYKLQKDNERKKL